jgi:tetratricopeptide (TPR) repeat protein
VKGKIKLCVLLFLLPLVVHARELPGSFFIFRDAVYSQNTHLLETMRLYTAAKQDIEKTFSGAALYLAFSRCEYLAGLSFLVEGRKDEAAAFFEQGIAWAEESLAIQPESEAYRLLGTNISFLCEIRRSYGFVNFSKIRENAQKALDLNPDNLTARYLIAAAYVAAPWPFGNARRGAALLEEILRQDITGMEREDIDHIFSLDLLSYSLTGILNQGWGIGLSYEKKIKDCLE